jgi:CDP-glucose 4,6-dehydratase
MIRNPNATRRWQHLLEPLSGYLALAERLYTNGQVWAKGRNFGPPGDDARPVRWIVERLVQDWGRGASWCPGARDHPQEAHHLKLDISKARQRLCWQPKWPLAKALERSAGWRRSWLQDEDRRSVTLGQIAAFCLTPHTSTRGA